MLASDEIKTKMAEKVSERLAAIDKYAEGIINEHHDVYEAIIDALMEKQILTREELLEIKEKATAKAVA